MSLSVEDTGDAIVVSNPLKLGDRLFSLTWNLMVIILLVFAAWRDLSGAQELEYRPYFDWLGPVAPYAFPVFAILAIAGVVSSLLTEGPETWTFNNDGIAYARKSLTGTRRRQWGSDGLTKIVYRARRLDGPDLFRLELHLKKGPKLGLVWMRSCNDRDALGDRLQEMFPAAVVKLDRV